MKGGTGECLLTGGEGEAAGLVVAPGEEGADPVHPDIESRLLRQDLLQQLLSVQA
jgi:hypothetical protein